MDWQQSSAPTPRPRYVPFSILLNPDELDGPDASFHKRCQLPSPSTAGHTSDDASGSDTLVVAAALPQPKRRGRKPHLPKMTNSERGKYYRSKRKRYGDDLIDDVAALKASIDRLGAMKEICCDLSLSTRMSLPGSLGKLVREYFTQFRHGVQVPPSRRNMALPDVEISTSQQSMFMQATMEPDVGFGEYRGIDTVMDQWQRYSQYHALLVFELESMRITGPENAPIISATGWLRTRYSRKTIENVFPHVIGNEQLVQRLIGKEIVYPFRNQFFFTQEGKVQRYDVEADFVEAMVNALGNTADAALLLGQALIQQQHMVGVLDDDDDSHARGVDTSRIVSEVDDTEMAPEQTRSPQLEGEYPLDDAVVY